MKKEIAVLFLLSAGTLLLGGCAGPQESIANASPQTNLANTSPQANITNTSVSTETQASFANASFYFSVKGCAETDKGVATKAAGPGTEKAPEIEVVGSQIAYSRALNHLCCRKAVVEKEINGSAINFYEAWSGLGCKCMCFSEIKASASGIPPGDYEVNVFENGTAPDGSPLEQKIIISKNVSIQ